MTGGAYAHEVIDYDYGVYGEQVGRHASLRHLLFDTEAEAQAYRTRRPHNRTTYQHRFWGREFLRGAGVSDYRAFLPPDRAGLLARHLIGEAD